MVWSRLSKAVVLILLLSLAAAGSAHADSVYTEGTISTTYVEYAKGVVNGLPPAQSYVFFRSGQYTYDLIASDTLKVDGKSFEAVDYTRYTWTTGSGYNSVPTYNVSIGNQFTLNSGNVMVYSNLAGFPCLEERGSIYAEITCLLLAVLLLGGLLRSLFTAVDRLR